jgi:hypothetical protein
MKINTLSHPTIRRLCWDFFCSDEIKALAWFSLVSDVSRKQLVEEFIHLISELCRNKINRDNLQKISDDSCVFETIVAFELFLKQPISSLFECFLELVPIKRNKRDNLISRLTTFEPISKEEFLGIQLVETDTIFHSAAAILERKQANTVVVTNNPILKTALGEIDEKERTLRELFLSLMRWLLLHSEVYDLLNVIMHPIMHDYWKLLPAKLEWKARIEKETLKNTLLRYIPESSLEKIKEFEDVFLCTVNSFEEALLRSKAYFDQWGLDLEVPICKSFEELESEFELYEVAPHVLSLEEAQYYELESVFIADCNEGEWGRGNSLFSISNEDRKKINLKEVSIEHELTQLLNVPQCVLFRSTNAQPLKMWKRLEVLAQSNQQTIVESYEVSLSSKDEPSPMIVIPKELPLHAITLCMRDPELFLERYGLNIKPLRVLEDEVKLFDVSRAIYDELSSECSKESIIDSLKTSTLGAYDQFFVENKIEICVSHFLEFQQEGDPVIQTQLKGSSVIDTKHGYLSIYGKIDRVERVDDSSVKVISYSMTSLPSNGEILSGQNPELFFLGKFAKEIFQDKNILVEYWNLQTKEKKTFLWSALEQVEINVCNVLNTLN